MRDARLAVVEETLDRLPEHARIPIRFLVRSVLEVRGADVAAGVLRERRIRRPWVKDYDAVAGEGPTRWAKRWDLSGWGLLAAYLERRRIGGCVLARDTEGVERLRGRDDLAVLWDLRVHPDFRRQGAGRELFRAAARWARDKGCRELEVETQDVNVPACRLYAREGCRLLSVRPGAYPECPGETELLWRLVLPAGASERVEDDGPA